MFDKDKDKDENSVHEVTDKERAEVKRVDWRPLYDAQLKSLVAEMEGRYGSPLEKEVMSKLEKAATTCAKNRVIIDAKYPKGKA